MELQHFSHVHPLVCNEEPSNESGMPNCSGCGELVSGPNFSCMACRFYLDKKCAEAPSELTHPFHRNHNLTLLTNNPYEGECQCPCAFCNKNCENFVYHCSCELDLHIKCALISYSIAEKQIGELQIAHVDPLISSEIHSELKEAECFACWKPLLDSAYLSLDSSSRFCLHKKCFELPLEINHLCHHQHSLFLQFNCEHLPCQMCLETQYRGFVYCCSHCQFVLHIECSSLPTQLNHLCYHKHPLSLQINSEILHCQLCQKAKHDQIVYCCSICKFCLHTECASPPPTIKDKIHQHPFILFPRHVLYICDACGSQGNYVSYICSTCGITVHKDCISVPRIIKFYRHEHCLLHTYFLDQYEFELWECSYCNEEVNKDHGGYFCSKCNYIVHVKCVLRTGSYYEVDSAEIDDESKDLVKIRQPNQ